MRVLQEILRDNFNSHTREGVTYSFRGSISGVSDFNSHTREGVTSVKYLHIGVIRISTHTPVRV